jgi:hypothetical protein
MSKPKPNLRAMFEMPEPAAAREQTEPAPSAIPAAKASKKDSHPGKKPVLIHIPEAMHKDLRRIALEEGTPLTQITERLLRKFLVAKGYTHHAPDDAYTQGGS